METRSLTHCSCCSGTESQPFSGESAGGEDSATRTEPAVMLRSLPDVLFVLRGRMSPGRPEAGIDKNVDFKKSRENGRKDQQLDVIAE